MRYRSKFATLVAVMIVSLMLGACGGSSTPVPGPTNTTTSGGGAATDTTPIAMASPTTMSVMTTTTVMPGGTTPTAGVPTPVTQSFGAGSQVINLAFTPSSNGVKVMGNAKPVAEALAKATGYKVNVTVPTSYQAVIESMGAGNTDVAFLAPFAYVLANQKYNVQVQLTTIRGGQTGYPSVIITADPNVKTLADLKGKSFAFVDSASASGYLYPYAYIKSQGFDPNTFFSQVTNAGGHDKVVLAVYNGQVAGGAIFGNQSDPKGDARSLVAKDKPDVFDKVRIIASTDLIPNDTVSTRKDLDPAVTAKVVQAMLDYAATDEGKAALKALYQIDGLQKQTDAAYDPIRNKAKDAGVDIGKAVK